MHSLHQVVLVQAGVRHLTLATYVATYHQHSGGWWLKWMLGMPGGDDGWRWWPVVSGGGGW